MSRLFKWEADLDFFLILENRLLVNWRILEKMFFYQIENDMKMKLS
jgi:hypothetical protein